MSPGPELLISELARVTRPGGQVLLIDQLASPDPLEAMVHDRIERLRDPSHTRTLSDQDVRGLLEANSLVLRRFETFREERDLDRFLDLGACHGAPSEGGFPGGRAPGRAGRSGRHRPAPHGGGLRAHRHRGLLSGGEARGLMPLLYDAVGFGMWAYSRSAFRVRTLGRQRLDLEPGTLLVCTHRRESDVPLVCPSIYFGPGGLITDRSRRMSFAAREDMFSPGFFAGFPSGLPLWLRRLLFPVGIDPYLRGLTLFPIRSATVVRLEEVFRRLPQLELAGALPPEDLEALRNRARDVAPAGAAARERGPSRRVRRPPVEVAHPGSSSTPRLSSRSGRGGPRTPCGTSASSLTSSRGGQSS